MGAEAVWDYGKPGNKAVKSSRVLDGVWLTVI